MTPFNNVRAVAKFALLLATIVVLQGILAFRIPLIARFDLPLIYCIYYGFTRGRPLGAVAVGSVLGLLQDSLSGVALGTNGFSKTAIAFFAASAGWKFDVDQTITRVIALIFFTLVDSVLKVVLGGLAGVGPFSPGATDLVVSIMLNTCVGLIFFFFRSRPDNVVA